MVDWLDSNLYLAFARNWDDTQFRERILAVLKPDHMVCDLGAGAGIIEQMNFKGLARRVCGVDVVDEVLDNPMLDEARVADGAQIPYEDATFDIVFADNVLEHLAEPEKVFRDVWRVLKPGGMFLFKTPNKWHYMPTIARTLPHSLHVAVNRWRGRRDADIFPTLYRANTKGAVERLALATGFEIDALERVEGRPEYLRFSTPTYLAGALYERIVNATPLLEPFRIILVGALRKKA